MRSRLTILRMIRAQQQANASGHPLTSRKELLRILRGPATTLATAPALPPEIKQQLAHADHSTLLIAYLDALIDAKNGDPHAHEIADALHAMLHGENIGWRKHAPVTTLALPHLPVIQKAQETIKAHPQVMKQALQRDAQQAAAQKPAKPELGTAANPFQLPKTDRPSPKPPPFAKTVPLGNQRVVGAMQSNLKHPEFNPFHPHHEEALHDLHQAIREHKTTGTPETEANLEAAKQHFTNTTGLSDASVLNRADIGQRVAAVSSGLRNARHMGTPGTAAHTYATETAAEHAQSGPYQSYGRHQAQPQGPPTVQSTKANPVPPPPPPGGFKQQPQAPTQQQPTQSQPTSTPTQAQPQAALQQAQPQAAPQPVTQSQAPIKLEQNKPNPFTGRMIRHPDAHWDPTTNSVIYSTGGTKRQPQTEQQQPAQAEPPENPHATALAQKIIAHHQDPNAPAPTTDDYKQFAEHATSMPTQQQVSIRNEVLGSVDNPQMKEQMANAVRHGLAAKFEHDLRPNADLDAEFAKPSQEAKEAPGHPTGTPNNATSAQESAQEPDQGIFNPANAPDDSAELKHDVAELLPSIGKAKSATEKKKKAESLIKSLKAHAQQRLKEHNRTVSAQNRLLDQIRERINFDRAPKEKVLPGNRNQLEDAYVSIPGFDTLARTVAIENPGMLGAPPHPDEPDSEDYAKRLWDLLIEPKMKLLTVQEVRKQVRDEFERDAAEYGGGDPETHNLLNTLFAKPSEQPTDYGTIDDNGYDYAHENLHEKTKKSHGELTHQHQEAEDEFQKELKDARVHSSEPEIKESVRGSEEAGHAEEPLGEFGGDSEDTLGSEFGRGESDDSELGDTDFNFGTNEVTDKPNKPDQNHNDALLAMSRRKAAEIAAESAAAKQKEREANNPINRAIAAANSGNIDEAIDAVGKLTLYDAKTVLEKIGVPNVHQIKSKMEVEGRMRRRLREMQESATRAPGDQTGGGPEAIPQGVDRGSSANGGEGGTAGFVEPPAAPPPHEETIAPSPTGAVHDPDSKQSISGSDTEGNQDVPGDGNGSPPKTGTGEHPEGEMPAVRALKGLWEHARDTGSEAILAQAKDTLSQFSTAALYDAAEEFGHPDYRKLGRGDLLKRLYGWLDWMATTTHKPGPGQPQFHDTHYKPPYPAPRSAYSEGSPQNPMQLPIAITPHQIAAAYRQAKTISDADFADIGKRLQGLSREELRDALSAIGIHPNPTTTRERLAKQIHDMIGARRGLTTLATAHAPAGGITIAGKPFEGGEFIPEGYVAKATAAQHAQMEHRPDLFDTKEPQQPQQPVSRAAAIQAKYQEFKQARAAAFNEAKADAETAKGKAAESFADIHEHSTYIASVMGDGSDLTNAYTHLEELCFEEPSENAAELFEQFKALESAAKEGLAANKNTKPGTSDTEITREDLTENAKLFKAIIAACKEGREHLRTYAQHRKDMKDILGK